MKEILTHQLEAKKPTKWIKQIKEYLEELQININTIQPKHYPRHKKYYQNLRIYSTQTCKKKVH